MPVGTSFRLVNAGQEDHEFFVVRANEGTTETLEESAMTPERIAGKLTNVGAVLANTGKTSVGTLTLDQREDPLRDGEELVLRATGPNGDEVVVSAPTTELAWRAMAESLAAKGEGRLLRYVGDRPGRLCRDVGTAYLRVTTCDRTTGPLHGRGGPLSCADGPGADVPVDDPVVSGPTMQVSGRSRRPSAGRGDAFGDVGRPAAIPPP